MARQVQISGKSPAVKMRDNSQIARALGDVGKGTTQLGQGFDILSRDRDSKQANLALAGKIKTGTDKTQVDLYKAEASDRARVFSASQKDIWDSSKLEENQKEFQEREADIVEGLFNDGIISEESKGLITSLEMPKIISQIVGDTDIQLGTAQVNETMANYDKMILRFTNIGDAESANLIVDEMFNSGYLNVDAYNKKISSNLRMADRGKIRLKIRASFDQVELAQLSADVVDPEKYENLSQEDRPQLMDEIQNQQLHILKSNEIPATKALKNAYTIGKLTLEQIWASKAPQMEKELYAMLLQNRRTVEYRKMGGKPLGELSKLVSDYMDGGYIGSGGTKKQQLRLIEWMNDNKTSNYVIMDILRILKDGQAGDNAMAFLKLDRSDVKYPSWIKPRMEAFRSEFDRLTADLTPSEQLNAFGTSYLAMYNVLASVQVGKTLQLGFAVFDDPETKNLIKKVMQPLEDAQIERRLKRQAQANLGIISVQGDSIGRQTPPEQYAGDMNPLVPLQLDKFGFTDAEAAEAEGAIRNIISINNATLEEAVEFYKFKKRNNQ